MAGPATIKDTLLRDLVRSQDRERIYYEDKWGWFFNEQPELTERLVAISNGKVCTRVNCCCSCHSPPCRGNTLPHVSDHLFMQNWQIYPKTSFCYSIPHVCHSNRCPIKVPYCQCPAVGKPKSKCCTSHRIRTDNNYLTACY